MLDYICITSIINTCQMALFMVVACIVTGWSYFKLQISDWQVSYCCYMEGHVLSYLSHGNVIYGDFFLL